MADDCNALRQQQLTRSNASRRPNVARALGVDKLNPGAAKIALEGSIFGSPLAKTLPGKRGSLRNSTTTSGCRAMTACLWFLVVRDGRSRKAAPRPNAGRPFPSI